MEKTQISMQTYKPPKHYLKYPLPVATLLCAVEKEIHTGAKESAGEAIRGLFVELP